jgi:tetratricopeptide (TPR) repeat protein
MKIDTISNRFMVSSQFNDSALPIEVGSPPRLYAHLLGAALHKTANHSQAIQGLARRLIRVAELAYGARDIDALNEVSEVLTGLPLQSARDAGLYYLALIAKRQGELERSRGLLDPLTTSSSPIIQARAIQSLATVYECEGNMGEAVRLHVETLRVARHVDPFSVFGALAQLSALKSTEGDHTAALSDLNRALPIVRAAAKQHPYLWPLYHNELAVELGALEKIEEARAHSRIAVASPFAPAYQEWHETAEEPERVLVVVPELKAKPKAERQAKRDLILCYLRLYLSRHSQRQFLPAASKNLYPQPESIINQVKARAPDRAPPAYPL